MGPGRSVITFLGCSMSIACASYESHNQDNRKELDELEHDKVKPKSVSL